jgi:thymidine phosphorylase
MAGTREDARRMLQQAIDSGTAIERLARMIAAQGGDARVIDQPDVMPHAAVRREILADRDGVVASVEPRILGRVIVGLGGGRQRVGDVIHPEVGLEVPVKPGVRVSRGELLATVHARTETDAETAIRGVSGAITLTDTPVQELPLIGWRIDAAGVSSKGGR